MIKKEFEKKDAGKNRLELIDPDFILLLGEVLTFGAEKYEADNWKLMLPKDLERIKGALMRHEMAYFKGEKIDSESGLSHLGHIGFGLMVLNYFDNKED